MAMEEQTPGNDWAELVSEWQAMGRQWLQWWSPADATTMPTAMPLEWGNAAFSVLAPNGAWIDPVAAAELTERYNVRLEALWQRALAGKAVPASETDAAAHARDRRFGAKEWREQPFFAWLRDSYLLYADYVRELAALAQGDADAKKRLRFLAQQYADAIAPSNFLATNPEALKLALESGGASIAQGLANLIGDAQRGRIAMTDESAFAVGGNLACAPGSVVFRNELIELIQYAPATAKVYKRPLLIVPPCINKYYILDLRPENSFVRHIVAAGHTTFMVSWRNIPTSLGHLTWDDYLEQGVLRAIAIARADLRQQDGQRARLLRRRHTARLRAGGARGATRARVASATFLTTLLDFEDPGEIGVYVSREYLAAREPALLAGARVRGSELANAFASLRPNELVWNYVVSNYLKGRTPPAFDLLFWNGDSANLAGPMYAYYLRHMYLENRLRERGALTMCGQAIDFVPRRDAELRLRLARRSHRAVAFGVPHDPATRRRSDLRARLRPGTSPASSTRHRAGGATTGPTSCSPTIRTTGWHAPLSHPGSWWPHWTDWLAALRRRKQSRAGARGQRAPSTARALPRAPTCVEEVA